MPRLTNITVRGAFGHNHYTPAEFARLPLAERIGLIVSRRVEFLDEHGNSIPAFEAVEQLPHALPTAPPKPQ